MMPNQSSNKIENNPKETLGGKDGFHDPKELFSEDPNLLIYFNDPEFQELLSAYQNAKWDFCLKRIDKFQKLYPEDNYLPSFKKEIEIRFNFENERKKQHKKERNSKLIKIWGRVFVILTVIVLTSWGYFNYQDRILSEQQVLDASNLASSLESKFQNAENLMLAGKPAEGLKLYEEIQQVDPSFPDIDLKIEQAQKSISIEELYQEGVCAESEGDLQQALSSFLNVESLSPKYKDTQYLIEKIRIEQHIQTLIVNLQEAYSKKDWKSVASTFESIKELDPNIDLSDENLELLFISLHNLVVQTVDKGNLTLDEIESAVHYYKIAMTLFPQDKKFTAERENLQNTTTELLVNKYFLFATNLLESSNYNSQSLNEAIRILTQIENINGGSQTISQEIKKTKLFLDSYNHFLSREFDQAIVRLEELRRLEENYASGKVNYLLLESYLAYGDILFKYADFSGARDQYLEAEKYAWRDLGNGIRLFQVELRVAKVLNRLWLVDETASYYEYAFNLIDYKQHLINTGNQELLDLIEYANTSFDEGRMREAITLYEKAVEEKDKLFEYSLIEVNHGDSLPDLAFQYGCTIEMIKSVNQLGESLIIQLDQDLLIPVE